MARSVTLLDLKTRARTLSDTQNDVNVTDAELVSLANRHLPKVYDALVDAGPPDYYASVSSKTSTAGASQVPLDFDFRNLLAVYVHEASNGQVRKLRAMPSGSRARYKAPAAAYILDLEYVPACPPLVLDSDTFDGVSGFDELVACLMARDVMIKRQDDPSAVMASIQDEKERIVLRGRNRDKGAPKRIVDLDDDRSFDPWSQAFTTKLSCYRLFADVLEIYEDVSTYP